jgi:hypothetical protein
LLQVGSRLLLGLAQLENLGDLRLGALGFSRRLRFFGRFAGGAKGLGEKTAKRTEETDTSHHDQNADDADPVGDGKAIAVADRGDRYIDPPEGIGCVRDIGVSGCSSWSASMAGVSSGQWMDGYANVITLQSLPSPAGMCGLGLSFSEIDTSSAENHAMIKVGVHRWHEALSAV